jgi:hypothetical protein
MPVDSTSTNALAFASIQVDPRVLSKCTNAVAIYYAPYDKGWLYRIECHRPKTYDEFNEALIATERILKASCFIPILDDSGSTDGRIMLNPPKDTFKATEVWRRLPKEDDQLIPGLERLSKQLRVDFATNAHSGEGKRKREQTKTVYDEESAAIPRHKKTPKARKAMDESHTPFVEKALDAVNESHAEAMAAKDETIRALTSALAMKEELVNTQASLIAILQRGLTHSP